tara:strand:+ start:16417 stop:16845 length:429 start_codon:yes stop_codon:yes gene_type:complete
MGPDAVANPIPHRHVPPTFLPAKSADTPVAFHSIDALAVHLLQLRPGCPLELLPQQCSRNGQPEFPVVAVFALRPIKARAFKARLAAIRAGEPDPGPDGNGGDGPLVFADDWLGWTAGEWGEDPAELAAALRRMASAGGLAA